jgi:hypothetical protein
LWSLQSLIWSDFLLYPIILKSLQSKCFVILCRPDRQSLKIYRDIGDRYSQANALQNLALLYQQTGRVKEGFALSQEATEILTELGLLSYAFPKWINNIVKFAKKGRHQMIFCFIGGIFAFPFMLTFIVSLTLWRLTIGRLKR